MVIFISFFVLFCFVFVIVVTNLAPVVQTLHSAIHWINHYPVNKYYWGNQMRYPRHLLNNWALY